MVNSIFFKTIYILLISLVIVTHVNAQEDLAKKSQNPVGNIISVP
jgi:hypothetical protein